ncbi:MAG: asparaginase, partial [Clostridia bacterium]|nr:asparaginase [Clostridia bacterium]
MKKKIAVIFTGGTIGCISVEGSRRLSDGQRYLLLREYMKRYGERDFLCDSPFFVLSENMEASYLLMLSDAVRKACEEADGVIVTHGTDTLAFTAAYLGYLFSDSLKPIVLVSSRAPVGEPDANGVDNLAAAVALIEDSAAHRGVFVSYRNLGEHTKILRATRVLMQSAFTDAVCSLGAP